MRNSLPSWGKKQLIVMKSKSSEDTAGCRWRARVQAGDVIFFPRKHVHSLQCTAEEGMDVVGLIHPGTNPGINY